MQKNNHKIGIDVRTLETSHKFRGIGAYSRELLKEIIKQDRTNDYIFFTQCVPSSASKLARNKHFKHKDALIRKAKDPLMYNWYKDQVYFPRAIKRSKVELIHVLEQLSVPFMKNVKTIATVHDLIQIGKLSPHTFKSKIKIFPTKNVDRIIAISEAVKKELINNLRIDPKKIKVIYNGYDQELFKPSVNKKPIYDIRNKLLERPKEDKMLLYIGSYGEHEPRKNVNFLIEVL